MKRLVPITLLLAVATGCVFVDDRDGGGGRGNGSHNGNGGYVNQAPLVLDATSWCAYDDYNADDVWSFDATVDDPNGLLDVVSAWADVYDERTGEQVDSFELYPTDDPTYWFSDWLVSSTNLDCWYPGYSIDVTVYDSADAYDVLTIYPDTYR